MYLLNFKLLKSPKLTNYHLEIGNLERNFDFKGHHMKEQHILIMFCLIK
jgi:hypothetical protein